jgi:hypothetical protein
MSDQPSASAASLTFGRSWAKISDDGLYRYELGRVWNDEKPRLAWIMLNPSTADGEQDDPTIRRCMGFARAWDYGGIYVYNVYAYRATDPKMLAKADDPFGPMNGCYLLDALRFPMAIVAWGSHPGATARFREWLDSLQPWQRNADRLHALGLTKDGHPRHPLYLPGKALPERWSV